jgi:branched-chain amino acid transport system ATP-binding protein
MAILKADKMTKRFGGLVAVDELDVDIKENSIHSIIGPNGGEKRHFSIVSQVFTGPKKGRLFSIPVPWWD